MNIGSHLEQVVGIGRRAADRGGRPALGEMVQVPPRCASEIREFILATRHEKIILRAMRQWIATLLLIVGGSCWAADAIVKDGDTLILGDTSYKLDGIDAPEPDQVCLDEKDTIWRCGIEARDRLAKLIDSRTVRCDDKGPDPAYPARRIGVCWIDGQNLNQLLVRDGWACEGTLQSRRIRRREERPWALERLLFGPARLSTLE